MVTILQIVQLDINTPLQCNYYNLAVVSPMANNILSMQYWIITYSVIMEYLIYLLSIS